jgi:hypothetical protein
VDQQISWCCLVSISALFRITVTTCMLLATSPVGIMFSQITYSSSGQATIGRVDGHTERSQCLEL